MFDRIRQLREALSALHSVDLSQLKPILAYFDLTKVGAVVADLQAAFTNHQPFDTDAGLRSHLADALALLKAAAAATVSPDDDAIIAYAAQMAQQLDSWLPLIAKLIATRPSFSAVETQSVSDEHLLHAKGLVTPQFMDPMTMIQLAMLAAKLIHAWRVRREQKAPQQKTPTQGT